VNDNLNYAAAYYPNLRTTLDYRYRPEDVNVIVTTITGATSTTAAPVRLNTLRNPQPPEVEGDPETPAQTAIYNLAIASIRNQLSPTLPPSPAMAGIYAKLDGSRGAWRAAA